MGVVRYECESFVLVSAVGVLLLDCIRILFLFCMSLDGQHTPADTGEEKLLNNLASLMRTICPLLGRSGRPKGENGKGGKRAKEQKIKSGRGKSQWKNNGLCPQGYGEWRNVSLASRH